MKFSSLMWACALLSKDKQYAALLYYTVAAVTVAVPLSFMVSIWSSALTLTVAAFVFLHHTFAHVIRLLCRVSCTERAAAFEYSYGYTRLRELLQYANSCVILFAGFSTIMEGMHRFFEPHDIHPGFVGLTAAMLVAFTVVSLVAAGKEQYAKAQSLAVAVLSQSYAYFAVFLSLNVPEYDVPIASVVAVYAMKQGLPSMAITSSVLLQKFPAHLQPLIDNALRAAASGDGVLGVKDEHFWTLSDGVYVGTFTLRVRWDANEQKVLREVLERFDPILTHCTVSIEKDTWDRVSFEAQQTRPATTTSAPPVFPSITLPAMPPPPSVAFPAPPPSIPR